MAQIHFQPPDPLNFKSPEDWPRWKQQFDQFRVASGLFVLLLDSQSKQTKQVSTLLYCMGQEAETVLTSTNITNELFRYSFSGYSDRSFCCILEDTNRSKWHIRMLQAGHRSRSHSYLLKHISNPSQHKIDQTPENSLWTIQG